jgi:hypothetical protein
MNFLYSSKHTCKNIIKKFKSLRLIQQKIILPGANITCRKIYRTKKSNKLNKD